jgi:hypothetical protein
MELGERHLRRRAEYRRQIYEQAARSNYRNAAEALQEFRDLFDSDEEMDEFADLLDQLREDERARCRD